MSQPSSDGRKTPPNPTAPSSPKKSPGRSRIPTAIPAKHKPGPNPASQKSKPAPPSQAEKKKTTEKYRDTAARALRSPAPGSMAHKVFVSRTPSPSPHVTSTTLPPIHPINSFSQTLQSDEPFSDSEEDTARLPTRNSIVIAESDLLEADSEMEDEFDDDYTPEERTQDFIDYTRSLQQLIDTASANELNRWNETGDLVWLETRLASLPDSTFGQRMEKLETELQKATARWEKAEKNSDRMAKKIDELIAMVSTVAVRVTTTAATVASMEEQSMGMKRTPIANPQPPPATHPTTFATVAAKPTTQPQKTLPPKRIVTTNPSKPQHPSRLIVTIPENGARPDPLEASKRINEIIQNHPANTKNIIVAAVTYNDRRNAVINTRIDQKGEDLNNLRDAFVEKVFGRNASARPDVKWYKIAVGDVRTGAFDQQFGQPKKIFSASDLEAELRYNNPDLADIKLLQEPQWLKRPETLAIQRSSTFRFAIQDEKVFNKIMHQLKGLMMFGKICSVSHYTDKKPVQQCQKCWKYDDHITNLCSEPKRCRLCGSKDHDENGHRDTCEICLGQDADMNSEESVLHTVCTHNISCIFCEASGRNSFIHPADSTKCPERLSRYGTFRENNKRPKPLPQNTNGLTANDVQWKSAKAPKKSKRNAQGGLEFVNSYAPVTEADTQSSTILEQ